MWGVLLSAQTVAGQSGGHTGEIGRTALLLSDVHLNPFPTSQQCQTIAGKQAFARLASEPAAQWKPQDFSFQGPPNGYGADTNEPLFESALSAMQKAAPKPSAILVPGDFLAHGFRGLWQACQAAGLQGASAEAAYREFTRKTIEFVLLRLQAKFPHTQIVPVLGNNDSDNGDYGVPSTDWLSALARELPSITENTGKSADWSQFGSAGYYSVELRDFPGVEVLALNSVLWSPKCSAAHSGGCVADGTAELAWLEARLKSARAEGKGVVVTGHVPPGINAFDTLHSKAGEVVTMYDDCGEAGAAANCVNFGQKVPALLADYSDVIRIGIFGHTHMNEFRVAVSGQKSVAVQIVPAVSPIYGNNPAFLVAQVSPGFSVADYQAWRLAIGNGAGWGREYDFEQVYGTGGMTGGHMQPVASELTKKPPLRAKYFLYFGSESERIVAPAEMENEYLCILTNLTPETALPCVMPEMGLP
jgi:sphingomyelin phosphodiesterase acid-like 3